MQLAREAFGSELLWKIPVAFAASDTYTLRVDRRDGGGFAHTQWSGMFSVVEAAVGDVVSPKASDRWEAGKSYRIQWVDDPLSVNVRLLTEDGNPAVSVASAYPASIVECHVPADIEPGQYRVRVESVDSLDSFSESPLFSITNHLAADRGISDELTYIIMSVVGALGGLLSWYARRIQLVANPQYKIAYDQFCVIGIVMQDFATDVLFSANLLLIDQIVLAVLSISFMVISLGFNALQVYRILKTTPKNEAVFSEYAGFYSFLLIISVSDLEMLCLYPWDTDHLLAGFPTSDGFPTAEMTKATTTAGLLEDIPQVLIQIAIIVSRLNEKKDVGTIIIVSTTITCVSMLWRVISKRIRSNELESEEDEAGASKAETPPQSKDAPPQASGGAVELACIEVPKSLTEAGGQTDAVVPANSVFDVGFDNDFVAGGDDASFANFAVDFNSADDASAGESGVVVAHEEQDAWAAWELELAAPVGVLELRPPKPVVSPQQATPTLAGEIRALKDLHDQGVLDSDEFKSAKAAVLDRYRAQGPS